VALVAGSSPDLLPGTPHAAHLGAAAAPSTPWSSRPRARKGGKSLRPSSLERGSGSMHAQAKTLFPRSGKDSYNSPIVPSRPVWPHGPAHTQMRPCFWWAGFLLMN
jgi:hypothetical protein